MGKVRAGKACGFWEFLYDMHLYKTKGEGLFKAAVISFSWVGGVHLKQLPSTISISIATSLFLFSVAIIMEYAVGIVRAEKIAAKIFPIIIVIISFFISFVTFGNLTNRPFSVELSLLYAGTIVLQVIIWLDVLIYLLIGKPRVKGIEENLKEVRIN